MKLFVLFYLLFVFSLEIFAFDDYATAKQNCQSLSGSTSLQNPESFFFQGDWDGALSFCMGKKCYGQALIRKSYAAFAEKNFDLAEQLLSEAFRLENGNQNPSFWKRNIGYGNLGDFSYQIQKRKKWSSTPKFLQQVFVYGVAKSQIENQVHSLHACDLYQMHLTMEVIARILESNTQGDFSLSIRSSIFPVTVDKFDKGMADWESQFPWDEELAQQIGSVVKDSDLIVFLYPKEGKIANAGTYRFSVIPKVYESPRRLSMRIPTGWSSVANLALVYHEYLHTVERQTGLLLTSHGSKESKKIREAFQFSNPESGESQWAEYAFENPILEKTKGDWSSIFSLHKTNPLRLTRSSLREYIKQYYKDPNFFLSSRQQGFAEIQEAYKLYNKGLKKEAAAKAMQGLQLFPYSWDSWKKTKWFVEKDNSNNEPANKFLKDLREQMWEPSESETQEE